ncbi:MAG: hypothetical protein WC322_03790 [Candidatus Paceibacterota bacterium]
MARYILIDNSSGMIYADTADLPGWYGSDGTPETAARLTDEQAGGVYDLSYTLRYEHHRDNRPGYRVYRADIDGSEAVPVVQDGTDGDMIEAVERDCEYVGFVESSESEG